MCVISILGRFVGRFRVQRFHVVNCHKFQNSKTCQNHMRLLEVLVSVYFDSFLENNIAKILDLFR